MMMRALPAAGPVPSPCTSVCVIDPVTGFCAGCLRTLDEIASWSLLDDDAKRQVWSALPQRGPVAPVSATAAGDANDSAGNCADAAL